MATQTDGSSCAACKRSDSVDDFVQCDGCDTWWHFSCAGVTESVSDRAWICIPCQQLVQPTDPPLPTELVPSEPLNPNEPIESGLPRVPANTPLGTSSTNNNLSRLKERQALVRQRMEIELQKKFLEEQQQLMDDLIAEEDRNAQANTQDRIRTQNWVWNISDVEEGAVGADEQLPRASRIQQQIPNPAVNDAPSSDLAKTMQALEARLARCQQHSNPNQLQEQLNGLKEQVELCRKQFEGLRFAESDRQPSMGMSGVPQYNFHPATQHQGGNTSTPRQVRSLGAIPKQNQPERVDPGKSQAFPYGNSKSDTSPTLPLFPTKPIEQQLHSQARSNDNIIEQLRQLLARSDIEKCNPNIRRSNPDPYVHSPLVNEQCYPTQRQLAARQSLARDLPIFSGDPADWPIFISNYEYTTRTCGYNDGENMVRLQRSLKGHALESVRNRLVLPTAVPHVIEALRLRYGRPELLINALLHKVRSIPSPRSGRLQGLIEYGLAVQELCDHIEAADQRDHLANPTLLQELVYKLPADQKMMWAGYKRGLNGVNLKTFADYMTGVVQDATSVVMYEPENKKSSSKPKEYVNSHATDVELPSSSMKTMKPVECINCSKAGHKMRDCGAFKSLGVDERWKRVRSMGVCQICLFGHGKRSCRSESRCNVNGCQYRHHPLLHGRSPVLSIPRVAENHTHRFGNSSVLFRIIPVTLYGSSGHVNTFAFLDEGSSLTLIEGGLIAQLGVRGSSQPLCLRWTGNTSRLEKSSQVVTVVISGVGQKRQFKLANAWTVENLNLPSQSFDYSKAVEHHPYLKQLPLQSYQEALPKILIGLDNLRLALPLKVREGDGTGPTAVKTRLGWCVYGQQKEQLTDGYSFHICECDSSNELQETIKQFFAVEETGAMATPVFITKEEERAQRLLERSTKRVGQHFETALLRKQDDIKLPDSYAMAVRRLQCLERKLDRDPALNKNFHQQIQEYQNKGYAHRATSVDLQKADPARTWYLPLGVVTNPNKPGKLRVIWDASAKAGGISLNSMLLKGPDQLTALPAVLFRFRQFWVAVNADIQEMFHQIFIREVDKCALLFLYRKDKTQPVDVFMMDVVTFGATCSPASAQFVKNLNAKEHVDQFPRAVDGILRSHYVDDYLDSFGSVEEAKQVAEDVRHVHRNGGFNLRNWNSNCDEIIQHLGETKTFETKNLYLGVGESTERVLGMLWKPATDELCFSTRMSDEVRDLIENGNVPTKRQVLRCVMTLFDPLGLLSPFLIHGKVLIQDLWRAGTDWDEAIGDVAYDRWRRWVEMIQFVSTVKVPRCYFPQANEDTYEGAQLHVFVDASPTAYSCAVYLRAKNQDGVIRCALVAGKAKVAPLKPTSIPRLELQACVLGTRVLKFVQENHTIRVEKRVLWTDSTTAWHWIRSDPRSFKPFVAHRVGEILENTNATEWKWIRSRFNSAEEATKWGCGPYFSDESIWFDGPQFLQKPECEWPSSVPPSVNSPEEIRASVLHHATVERIIDYERFSSWDRLHRTVAYALRFLRNADKKQPTKRGQLDQAELRAAEVTILKLVQWESYPDEKNILQRNETLPLNERKSLDKSSKIYELVPVIDKDGLLRQYGRIGATKGVSYDLRYPVILPREHWVTRLVIGSYHRKYRHANSETTVNEIRQIYAISKLRALVKQFTRACMLCKLRKARPNIPPMAPLPPARLAVHTRPFSYVGLDYFGPLLVKVGRANAKRWIALFTCLTVRAVHLEVAFSLSTSSCVSCVRRFVGRRGSPVEFISDNGTNFQGAERLLREQISQGLSLTFTNASTKWTFIPPGAPHMGGAWERLVQSVKRAMMDAYTEGKLDDEGLQTLVVEAESIVNSRPLTYLPLDSEESEALTPNHFLMGSSSGANHVNLATGQPQYCLKDMWDQIQQKLDRLWYRWTVEYLPVIRRQPKWFEEVRPLQDGDLVLVVNNSERNCWVRGRVVQTILGTDDRVRQARVRTSGGIIRRPVAKLALLDVMANSAVLEAHKMHPGEDVAAAAVDLAALVTADHKGSAT